ncbi:hypothetical protein [Streptomyces sp. NBC_00199]|uniref:hypothetical protein n=1 Tax=Streptomyces sp. NBC_00199 TaxID=2975678 RepID=UPI00225ABE2D|nr:hypothetical protein [Streptomyces sp. NBC_00199]MCX5269404.1 hypothetical protein [Streptomyces sp. NBC_00199]
MLTSFLFADPALPVVDSPATAVPPWGPLESVPEGFPEVTPAQAACECGLLDPGECVRVEDLPDPLLHLAEVVSGREAVAGQDDAAEQQADQAPQIPLAFGRCRPVPRRKMVHPGRAWPSPPAASTAPASSSPTWTTTSAPTPHLDLYAQLARDVLGVRVSTVGYSSRMHEHLVAEFGDCFDGIRFSVTPYTAGFAGRFGTRRETYTADLAAALRT